MKKKNTLCFFFSSRRRHTRWPRDWSSDVCSSDLVGTHDPNKAYQRAAPFQKGEGLRCIGCRQIALEGGDEDARIFGHGTAQHQPLGERCEVAARLQGIAGCHQPPDLVEAKSLEDDFADLAMGNVRWIERSAKEADALARRRRWQTLDMAEAIWSELGHE